VEGCQPNNTSCFISHCDKENLNIWSSIFKTMAFLCFQITQVTRMIRELRPLQFAHLLRETSNSTAPPPRETGCTDLWRHCRHVKLRVRRPTFGKTVSRPTPMIDGQRNKKFAFKWSPTFPNSFPWGKFDSPKKKSLVGRLAAVGTRRGEFPSVLIWDILLKDQDIY